MYEADEVGGSAIVAGGEAAVVLEPVKASFDLIAMPVDGGVVRDGDLAAAVGRDLTAWAPMAAMISRKALLS